MLIIVKINSLLTRTTYPMNIEIRASPRRYSNSSGKPLLVGIQNFRWSPRRAYALLVDQRKFCMPPRRGIFPPHCFRFLSCFYFFGDSAGCALLGAKK